MQANSKPDQAEKTAPDSDQPSSAAAKRRGVKYTALLIAVLLVMLPGVAALWMLWQQQQQFDALESRLGAITSINNDVAQLGSTQRGLSEQLSTLQQAQREQGDALTKLQNQSPLTTAEIETEWALAEIKYLLNLANQRSLLAKDTEGAQLALSLADQQVRELGDYRMQPLRELIAEEQLALSAVGETDIAGIAASMSGLLAAIDNLRVITGPKQTFFDDTEAESPATQSLWRESIATVWAQLRSLVVIRQQQDAPAAVLMPEQRYFLYQNLRLQLETARFAALSGNQKMFGQSLQAAILWLEQYFVGDQRDAMLQTLQAMQTESIYIETPDISGSLRWLTGFEP